METRGLYSICSLLTEARAHEIAGILGEGVMAATAPFTWAAQIDAKNDKIARALRAAALSLLTDGELRLVASSHELPMSKVLHLSRVDLEAAVCELLLGAPRGGPPPTPPLA